MGRLILTAYTVVRIKYIDQIQRQSALGGRPMGRAIYLRADKSVQIRE